MSDHLARLNECVAVNIMGWHKHRYRHVESEMWRTAENTDVCFVHEWNPATNCEQAWQMLLSMRKLRGSRISPQDWDRFVALIEGAGDRKGFPPERNRTTDYLLSEANIPRILTEAACVTTGLFRFTGDGDLVEADNLT
jgi:hypothetical protein